MLARIATIITFLLLIVAVNVGFGLWGPVPAVFALVGLAMVARDFVNESWGRPVVAALIVVGAGISALLAAPAIALASVVAFVVAESLDFGVFVAVRDRLGLVYGVAISGVVGSIADSLIFLTIAFGSLAFFTQQVTGKLIATFAAVTVIALVQVARRRPILV